MVIIYLPYRLSQNLRESAGFTLVEIAIVLVIIGLMVGGVLSGQSLIHAAVLNSQLKQIREYDLAYIAFQTKYSCIPGDCGTNFTGVTAGNGNGYIENAAATSYDASGSNTWSGSSEYRGFFMDLSQSGLIGGTFNDQPVIGQGLPVMKYSKNGSFFASDSQSFVVSNRAPDTTNYRTGNNALWFVACNISGDVIWLWDDDCGIFTGVDLQALDQKMDDGAPLSGKLWGFGGGNTQNRDCLNGNTYKISNATPQCQAAYILD